MGGSAKGDFGNTIGKYLDALSNLLTAASLIPGVDTFADLAAVPVDLARGDYISAGLSALGAIPIVGEIADGAKAARLADDVVDAAKSIDKLTDGIKKANKAKELYSKTISNLPKNPKTLLKKGWSDSTPAGMERNTTSKLYTNKKTGLQVRFDKAETGASGYKGKDHYHVLNPNSTGKHDYYLDIDGNPVPKGSKASHIIP